MASTQDDGGRHDDGWRGASRTGPAGLHGVGRPPGHARTGPAHRAGEPRTRPPQSAAGRHGGRARPGIGRWVGRPLKWLAVGLLAAVPLLVLAVGLVYVKLLHGSIPMRFIIDPIRQTLAAELGGIAVAIDDAELVHNRADGAFELKLIGVQLGGAEGANLARASQAVVRLDIGALWSGRVAPERIVLIEPRLALVEDDAGTLSVRPGEPDRRPGSDPAASDAAARTPAESSGARGETAHASRPERYRVDLARWLAELVAQVRDSPDAVSHLKMLGVRDASVVIDNGERHALWLVPELEISLEHRQKRSVIIGTGRVAPGAAGAEPFAVAFRLEDSEKARSLRLECQVSRMVPKSLARNLPALGPLGGLDSPVSAAGWLDLTTAGDVVGGRFDIEIGEGRLVVPKLAGLPFGLDKARLGLIYHGDTRQFELAPSVIEMDGSHIKLAGTLAPMQRPGGPAGWQLDLKSLEGQLINDRNAPPLPIERLVLQSRHWPQTGAAELVAFAFKAGGAELDVSGAMPGADDRAGASLDGRIGTMSAETLKEVWPSAFAPQLRSLVARSLLGGQLRGGTFRIAAAAAENGGMPGAAAGAEGGRFSLALEGHQLSIAPAPGMPPLTVPRALLRIEGPALEITVPDASMAGADGRRLQLKAGHIAIANMDDPRPVAEVTGRAQGALSTVIEIASREGVGLLQAGVLPAGLEGKVEAQWRAGVPLTEGLMATESRLEAKVRISDGRIPDVLGTHDLTGASFTVGASEKAIDVKGDMLLAGVPVKAAGQWILGEDKSRQPPLTVTAKLDGADRRQLGLDIEEFVQGEAPVEMLFWPGQGEHGRLTVNVDLTGAELTIDGIAWKKPSGRSARVAFEVVRPKAGKGLELQGFKLSGDSIAIDGTVTLGPDNKAQSYHFPGFSLNVVSNLEVQGVRRPDKTWDVKAHGKTFDGSELMRSLYTMGPKPSRRQGQHKVLDLVATIDTVLGLNDSSLRQVRLQMRKQDDEIRSLNLKGTLDGGSPLEVVLQPQPGQPRILTARTTDVGQALKMIGFYSSMVGGRGELKVNLDGRGTAERSGELAVKRFHVLGDPVMSEVLQGADDSRPAIAQGAQKPERRIVREQIEFETLKATFSSGNGQVALESLAAAGPLMGASVRGKVDFRSRRLSLGGTYVPLSGLSRALAGVPLFGELLTGPRGDGIFGITFAVDGPMEQPQVIMNPFSLVAPGVLREIFQMVPEAPRVTPATEPGRPANAARVRASPPAAGTPGGTGGAAPRVLDGWSSESTRSGARNSP